MHKSAKKICLDKMSLKKEHKRIIPMLKKAGYKKEAKDQTREAKKYE